MRSCGRFCDCWGGSTKNTIHDGGHAECAITKCSRFSSDLFLERGKSGHPLPADEAGTGPVCDFSARGHSEKSSEVIFPCNVKILSGICGFIIG
jgi:hypothetical protein